MNRTPQAPMNPRKKRSLPVIIGVGQITHRQKIRDNGDSATCGLARRAVDALIDDTGSRDILNHLDRISLVHSISLEDDHPVDRLCDALGLHAPVREETAMGGNSPQFLVNRAADDIAAGTVEATLLLGTEALYREKKIRQFLSQDNLRRTRSRLRTDPSVVGSSRDETTPEEKKHGMILARLVYPLIENALRRHLNMGIEEYWRFLGQYFETMEEVARGNPLAWFPDGKTTGPLVPPSEGNPVFNFPYTKYMNPVLAVNQAAALLITSEERADRAGIPREKRVYLHGGADVNDRWHVTDRPDFHSSPAIRRAADAALRQARIGLPDVDFFDLYSCFPCAVLIAAMELGLPLSGPRPLTITGGLSYFGGAGNNYTMHAIAHAVERLRRRPEEFGLVTGLGWFMTKHSLGIYSGITPDRPWRREPLASVQAEIDAAKGPAFQAAPEGSATIETYTLVTDPPQGAPATIIIARLDTGERCLATADAVSGGPEAMIREDCIGRRGWVKPGGAAPNRFDFQ